MDARSPTAATLTRRSCLQGSALIALYAWAAGGARVVAQALGTPSVDAVVIDARLPEAATQARDAWTDARVELLRDDVAELFYGRLVPVWRARGVRGLAGLTRAPALFLLEPLASDYGLRTVGLLRAPPAGCAALVNLWHGPQRQRKPVSRDLVQQALLNEDHAAFAWWMAPVRRPLRAGVTVVPA
jgi:hypothetical protein